MVDKKIKSILLELNKAHKRSEKFIGHRLNGTDPIKPVDIFDMALAYDTEERLLLDLDLAYSKKYPERYSKEDIAILEQRRDKLSRDIRAWQNRQFPSQFRE